MQMGLQNMVCIISSYRSGFLQCFDIVGLVMWLVKIVAEMTYNVLSRTLSLYATLRTAPCKL